MVSRIGRPTALGLAASLATVAALAAAVPAIAGTHINSFSIITSTNQAGGHPDLDVHASMDGRFEENGVEVTPSPGNCDCEDVEGLDIHFPTGFIGDPHNVPQCTLAQFSQANCPVDSQVGVSDVATGGLVPIFNMVPHPGEPGLTAFEIPIINAPSFTSLRARTGSDYGLDASTTGILHLLPLREINVHLWGVPASPTHDALRFPKDIHTCIGSHYPEACFVPQASNSPQLPYTENPTTCGVPLTAGLDVHYYNGVTSHADYPMQGTVGCDQLSFNPSLTGLPTTTAADTASGMDIDLKVPQTQNASVPSPSEIRALKVTLPAGFSLDPNAADGKTSCTDAELNFTTDGPAECPEFAKIGTLELDSSALPGPIPGAIYIGQPLPEQKFRIFLVADGFETHVKFKGVVRLDPASGQVVTEFPSLPQAPFQDFNLHFFGSERGVFSTPIRCGTYQVESEFVPWDSVLSNQISLSTFSIASGPGGSPCPGATRPFSPSHDAGTPDNTAGNESPLALRLGRADGEQFLSGVAIKLAEGLGPSIKGVTKCPQSALDSLASSIGLLEMLSPACPSSSQIGTVVSGAGSGTRQLYNTGKLYLAGPYKGAPLSVETVVPAVGGPYDLGNAAVRSAIFVDPTTARIKVVSDPLPQILEGVPLRLRSLLFELNRPGLNRAPTNCAPKAFEAEIFGSEGAMFEAKTPYQVANCADLPFGPKLSLKLAGGLNRLGHPALHATLTAQEGDANISRATVTLPKNEQLDSKHLGNVCTRVQFAAGSCPASSQIGTATVDTPLLNEPLKGNVYLRSGAHLPDLVIALRGEVDIDLVGTIDTSKGSGLRTTFKSVPDAEVSDLRLNLLGGSKGLLINSASVCSGIGPALVRFQGQNGRIEKQRAPLGSCGSARHKRHHRHRGAGR